MFPQNAISECYSPESMSSDRLPVARGGNFSNAAYQPEAIKTSAYLAGAESYGADRLFTKPFHREELVEAVAQLLQERGTDPEKC